jgi:hypothetical protein
MHSMIQGLLDSTVYSQRSLIHKINIMNSSGLKFLDTMIEGMPSRTWQNL